MILTVIYLLKFLLEWNILFSANHQRFSSESAKNHEANDQHIFKRDSRKKRESSELFRKTAHIHLQVLRWCLYVMSHYFFIHMFQVIKVIHKSAYWMNVILIHPPLHFQFFEYSHRVVHRYGCICSCVSKSIKQDRRNMFFFKEQRSFFFVISYFQETTSLQWWSYLSRRET